MKELRNGMSVFCYLRPRARDICETDHMIWELWATLCSHNLKVTDFNKIKFTSLCRQFLKHSSSWAKKKQKAQPEENKFADTTCEDNGGIKFPFQLYSETLPIQSIQMTDTNLQVYLDFETGIKTSLTNLNCLLVATSPHSSSYNTWASFFSTKYTWGPWVYIYSKPQAKQE